MPAPLLAVAAVFITVAAWHAGVLWGVLVVAGMGGWYRWSIGRYPLRGCWRCGRGYKSDPVASGAFGRCWVCKGTGRRVRWGVVAFRHGTYQAIKSGKHGRNY